MDRYLPYKSWRIQISLAFYYRYVIKRIFRKDFSKLDPQVGRAQNVSAWTLVGKYTCKIEFFSLQNGRVGYPVFQAAVYATACQAGIF